MRTGSRSTKRTRNARIAPRSPSLRREASEGGRHPTNRLRPRTCGTAATSGTHPALMAQDPQDLESAEGAALVNDTQRFLVEFVEEVWG